MSHEKYRLVTRSDMDGLVCAILLKQMELIEDILFVHPKDVQDGKVPLTDKDITTNLPYDQRVHLAFDHHASEMIRVGEKIDNMINDPHAPSTSRVVYNHFGGKNTFANLSEEMLSAVDKADSARYTLNDILNPGGWELLSFLMDPRTGLGRFHIFHISNYDLMMSLIEFCRNHRIDEILMLSDVKERVDLYFKYQVEAKEQLQRCTSLYTNLGVLDLRNEETIFPTNRFLIYALNPQINLSMHVLWGLRKQNTVFAVGKSILNPTTSVDIGALMLEYGGGGHENAGTCQIPNEKAAEIKLELIKKLTEIS